MEALRRTDGQLSELDIISTRIDSLRAEPDPDVRSHGYRVWNRRFHHVIGAMAQSRVMTETSQRMWDLSDFLINTTGVPQCSEPAERMSATKRRDSQSGRIEHGRRLRSRSEP